MKRGRKSSWDTKIEPRLEEIKGWCRDGCTDQQICELLGISHNTFYRYKNEKSEFYDALKVTKEIADLKVENSLYKRATGYEIKETTTESLFDGRGNQIGPIKRKEIKKQIAPDVTAQIFWLKNRQPEKWRDRKNIEFEGRNREAPEIKINWIKSDD